MKSLLFWMVLVVLGVVICTATCVALANLVVDIVYAFLDPRVRFA